MLPRVDVQERDLVDGVDPPAERRRARRRPRRAAPLDLLVRHLVRVVPVRPRVLGDEPVDEASADRHGILRDPGDAVGGVGDVDAVPVQRRPVGDRLVDERDLDEVALTGADRRPGGGAVEGVALDRAAARHAHRAATRDELDPDVGGARRVRDERRDVDRRRFDPGRRRGTAPPSRHPATAPPAPPDDPTRPRTHRGRRRRDPIVMTEYSPEPGRRPDRRRAEPDDREAGRGASRGRAALAVASDGTLGGPTHGVDLLAGP